MKSFRKFIAESIELDEAVEVSHDRYMRSHGKKASGGEGNWMFTHKRMGDANVNDPKEVHSARGKFSDAKKSAQQWAKKHGHSTVYVMEEVELDEGILKPYHAIASKPWSQSVKDSKGTAGEYSQIAKGKDFTVWTGYSGSLKKQAHYVVRDDKIIGSGWTMASALKDAGLKDKDLTARSKFAAGSILNKGMKEEVEQIDEISKKTLGSYVKKAASDVANKAAEHDVTMATHSGPEARKHRMGLRKDIRKREAGMSKALDRLTKEEVEQIDEISKKTLGSYVKKASYDAASNAAKFGADQPDKKGGSAFVKAHQRLRGIAKATDRLTKD